MNKLNFEIKIICPKCKRRRPISENISTICCSSYLKSLIYFSDYENNTIKELIKFGKFEGYHSIWEFFSQIIAKGLEKLNFENFHITFVPMTKKEIKNRGFNQTFILAKNLSEKLNLTLYKDIYKVKETEQQVNLSFDERFKNIEGAFDCKTNAPKNIIIIDDVFTTGATMLEIAKTLKNYGSKNIIGIVIAK